MMNKLNYLICFLIPFLSLFCSCFHNHKLDEDLFALQYRHASLIKPLINTRRRKISKQLFLHTIIYKICTSPCL